jgi:hypothetical protein
MSGVSRALMMALRRKNPNHIAAIGIIHFTINT